MNKSDVIISKAKRVSYELNDVRKQVAQLFELKGLDKAHFGKSEWNPLGEYIFPHSSVLIKPNLVMEKNSSGEGEECLYTQCSVVECIVEFVIKALNGTGKIIIADAPVQACNFEKLVSSSGYREMIEKFKKRGIDIELVDLRNSAANVSEGIVSHTVLKTAGKEIDIGKESAFSNLSWSKLKRLRITNYNYKSLRKYHNIEKNVYLIADELLNSDVVINVPKPKTHRKAGITASLKNMIGINCSKEYLPHHEKKTITGKGDSYKKYNVFLGFAEYFEDLISWFEDKRVYLLAKCFRFFRRVSEKFARSFSHERFREGSWYGNDTIWRTISDVNQIVRYADKEGKMQNECQRKIINICDMIVAGDNDGPMSPSRRECGVLVFGEDACSVDEVICSMMGFEREFIPTLVHMRETKRKLWEEKEYRIVSNYEKWNNVGLEEIRRNSMNFVPNPGWNKEE